MKYFKVFCFLLLSCPVFADGTCHLTQNADGTYTIICEGDGMVINYLDVTNSTYIIENCEQLKSELLGSIDLLDDNFSLIISRLDAIDWRSDSVKGDVWELDDSTNSALIAQIQSDLSEIQNQSSAIKSELQLVKSDLSSTDNPNSLFFKVNSIVCGSCPTNSPSGGGDSGFSCCDVDIQPILDSLNSIHIILSSTSNFLSSVLLYRRVVSSSNYGRGMRYDGVSSNDLFWYGSNPVSILGVLDILQHNQYVLFQSLDNYLHKFVVGYLPSLSNNVENLLISSTNHFSFFKKSINVEGALSEFGMQSTFDNYYDFLTNHYILVNEQRYSDLTEGQKDQTNWFSRVETLLAALVFGDDKSTNTVDSSYGDAEKDQLESGLRSLEASSSSQVQLLDTMGDSLISSLRNIQSGFSSAIDYPSEIRLVTLPRSDNQTRDSDSNDISFQSSEILPLVEACHCATTLAWCLIGLVVLFKFVSWSIRSSYSLIVFCYSVLSSVFRKG